MLNIKDILEKKDDIISRLAVKNFNAKDYIENIILLENNRKQSQTKLDNILAEINSISAKVGELYKNNQKEQADVLKQKTIELKELGKKENEELKNIEAQIKEILLKIPNTPHISVPNGKRAEDNLLIKTSKITAKSGEGLLPHWEIAKKYDIIDFELGAKITGSGFPVYKGRGAKLQRALINFFLEEASNNNYTEIQPPILVNEDSAYGTGQLPDKEGQMYHATVDNFYLIPTAEVPITNIYRSVLLKESDLPIKNAGYTPCFRREAGSYGADVKGLNRLHQFDKIEIVQISKPEKSYETLEEMVNYVEGLLIKLELPYRIILLCGGDMSFASAKTYDFEVFSPAQNRWLEVSSVSNFETFQAIRMNLRYKDEESKKNNFAHTLNGSALALPRILAGILENHQINGEIKIPQELVKWTKFEEIK